MEELDNFDIYQMMKAGGNYEEEVEVVQLSSGVLHALEQNDEILNKPLSEIVDPFARLEDGGSPVILSSYEEEVIDEVEMAEEPLFHLMMAFLLAGACFVFVIHLWRKRNNGIRKPDPQRGLYKYRTFLMKVLGGSEQHAHFDIWQNDSFALKILMEVADVARNAAISLTMKGNVSTLEVDPVDISPNEIILTSAALFSEVFNNNGDEVIMQGSVPMDIEEQIFQLSCLSRSLKYRLTVRLADHVREEFEMETTHILEALSEALSIANVSDSYYGTALCSLFDQQYPHLELKTSQPFLAAMKFLEFNRNEKEKNALRLENSVTDNIVKHCQQSYKTLTTCQESNTQLNNNIQMIEQQHAVVFSEETSQVRNISSIEEVTLNSTQTASVTGDIPQHLSVLHHYNSIKENSNRSLMLNLQGIRASDEEARENAGVRAMAYFQNFKRRVNFDFQYSGAQSELLQEKDNLFEQEYLLMEMKKVQKSRQNILYGYFSCFLIAVGILFFFNGSLEFHSSQRDNSVKSSWLSQTEAKLIEWALFEMRMICTYFTEDISQKCDHDHIDQGFWNNSLFSSLTEKLYSGLFLFEAVSAIKNSLWTGLGHALSVTFLVDSNWVQHTMAPCFASLLTKLFPLWLFARCLNFVGFVSWCSLLVSIAALYSFRRPLVLFFEHHRLFGLVILFPQCLNVCLEHLDSNLSWRLYQFRRIDIRFWILYLIYPVIYVFLCHEMGKQ